MDAANAKKDTTRLRIVSLASDGESRHGKALTELTYITPLAPSSPIHEYLAPLQLFDLFVGADDITADKDYKHIFKWLWNTLLRDKGSVVCGIRLTRGLIRKHLMDTGLSDVHIKCVLDPSDKQDVLLAFNLLKDLVTITDSLTRLGTRSILTLYEIAPDRTWGSTYVYFYLLSPFTNVLGSCTVHKSPSL